MTRVEQAKKVLSKHSEISNKELARRMGLNPSAINTVASRARKELGISGRPGRRNKSERAGRPEPKTKPGNNAMTNKQLAQALFKLADQAGGMNRVVKMVDVCKQVVDLE